jgi:hypothetical protein
MIQQTILPFKLEMTGDIITPHADLALMGEFAIGLKLLKSVDSYLPKSKSGAGYKPSEYIFPLILMQDIYLNDADRNLFLETISEMSKCFEVNIFAYVLMSNIIIFW